MANSAINCHTSTYFVILNAELSYRTGLCDERGTLCSQLIPTKCNNCKMEFAPCFGDLFSDFILKKMLEF